ncbi:NAD(P)-dependent oxidoreductase [Salinispirillum marinum]|uniref:NAD(P)-dependent oxidoreductase n=2 Tax=Saccharospirillaceae TaxID=255527 RepID=A0ABV8BBE0_9GAMM
MKIAVFGGSGQTGRHVIQTALEKGYDVKALVRDPAKIDRSFAQDNPQRLKWIQGDLLDAEAVTQTLTDCDGFIFAAGPVKGGHPDLPYLAAKNVTEAATQLGIKRLVWLLGAAVIDERDAPDFGRKIIRFIMKFTARDVLESSERAYQHLVNSGLDYTVVRPPILANGPAQGNLKASYQPPKPRGISRTDLGRFMVETLTDDVWRDGSPMVSY